MDEYVAKSCRQLSTTNFEYILGLVEGSLAAGSSSSIADLVHLSTVLLQNHPSSQYNHSPVLLAYRELI